MARNAEAAGHSLKTKKPQCGNTEASEINAVTDQENNVMGDNSTAASSVIPFRSVQRSFCSSSATDNHSFQ